MCVCVYIYVCLYVYIYIYIYCIDFLLFPKMISTLQVQSTGEAVVQGLMGAALTVSIIITVNYDEVCVFI